MNPDELRQLAELLTREPGVKAIDLKDVRRLAQLLRDSPEIGSIEVKGWLGTGVVITRTSAAGTAAGVAGMPMIYASPPPQGAAESPRAAEQPPSALKEIKSPMVGTFYMAPEPGAEAYVRVGARITTGQTVCVIEAMKIMNEIEAEITGVIREVCVEDAQPVEFGQVLYRVDPHG